MNRFAALIALTLLSLGRVAVANVALSIDDVVTSDTGASFVVSATPVSGDEFPIGAYSINLQFDNFTGGVSDTIGFNFMNLLDGMDDAGETFGTTVHPGNINDPGIIQFVGFGPGAAVAGDGSKLLHVDLTVPGGFGEHEAALDVSIIEEAPVDPASNFTFVGGGSLELPGVTTIGNRPVVFDPCDVNQDGTCDAQDIDFLTAQIRAGSNDPAYDLNQNGMVTSDDRRYWVNDLMNTYFGDSNLDMEFNSSDLIAVFQGGEFEDGVSENSTWATGDWSGNGEFGSDDFILAFQEGGFEQGPRGAVASVPEPASLAMLTLGLLTIVGRVRNWGPRNSR